MKVLVTGGAGFIGSHVVERCLAAEHRVAVVDDLSTGRRENVPPRARLYVQDIRDPALADVFRSEAPDAVIHLAAQAAVSRSVANPRLDAEINILGSLNVLECCRQTGVRRVVYASTGGAAYGDTEKLPTPEDHPTRPSSPYGVSKVTVEQYLACWGGLYGLSTVALRYANVYGPRQSPHGEAGVIAIFTDRILRGEPCIVNGDGLQTRDYVYVGDIAEANALALDRPDVTGPVNLGTGVATSVLELFAALRAAAGGRAEARHGPPRPGEQRRSVLDATRARLVLGWTPRVALAEGLQRTFDALRSAAAG
ncbi:MAG TPA: NAD-dependent epimerase/dehydratase family protein [Methylomirabilota bacterium]|nr:NAD-dependent epimerase/dehydratase family protein [Methylomirabilota bacterium]